LHGFLILFQPFNAWKKQFNGFEQQKIDCESLLKMQNVQFLAFLHPFNAN
jgi:hypothetical protein